MEIKAHCVTNDEPCWNTGRGSLFLMNEWNVSKWFLAAIAECGPGGSERRQPFCSFFVASPA
jgi:hypothetical protein